MDIVISNLNYEKIFKNLNLEINKGDFITIVGKSGSGKSTLFKIITGLIETKSISFNKQKLNEKTKEKIRKNMGIILGNPIDNFVCETVIENIIFSLENLQLEKEEIDLRLNKIIKELKIEHLLNCNVNKLSGGEQQLIALASVLITNPKIIILDESMIMLDGYQKDIVLKLLKKLNREKKITIINFTNDIEQSTYGKTIALIDDKTIVLHKPLKEAFKEEKVFKKADIELPFMAELSNKLKYYELTNDIILDMNKMVNQLWK